jgi:hypothetical protein
MTDLEQAQALLEEAQTMDLNRVVVLGLSEENGSVIIHNVGNDMEAVFLIKTFVSTLEMSILEDLYARTKSTLN